MTMEQYLITHSLIAAWSYCFTCYESAHEEAYQDFLRTLRREPSETSPEAQNGIDFENDVYALCRGGSIDPELPWVRGARLVANELKGAALQVKAYRSLHCEGMDFLVYGRLDGLKAGRVKDVKFSNKSFASATLQGKYLDSSQHPCYLFIEPGAYCFDYVISDGEDIYIETYTRANTRPFEEIVTEFIRSLRDMGLLDEYKHYWKTK